MSSAKFLSVVREIREKGQFIADSGRPFISAFHGFSTRGLKDQVLSKVINKNPEPKSRKLKSFVSITPAL